MQHMVKCDSATGNIGENHSKKMHSIQVLLLSDLVILYLTDKVYTVKNRGNCNIEHTAMELFGSLAVKSICLRQMLVFFSRILFLL